MSDRRELAWEGAGVVGGAIVTAVAPDLVPEAWRLPVVLFGVALIGVSLFPRVRAFCNWTLQQTRGRMTLIFVGLLLILTGSYITYQGAFAGKRLAQVLGLPTRHKDKVQTVSAPVQPSARAAAPDNPFPGEVRLQGAGSNPLLRTAQSRVPTASPVAASVAKPNAPVKPLKRMIAYQAPTITVTTQDGDGASFAISNILLSVVNVGDDTISVVVPKFQMYVDDKLVWNVLADKPFIVAQTQSMDFRATSDGHPLSISTNNKMITIKIEISYDTIPETGTRVSARTIQYPVNFANGPKSPPLLNSSQITEQSER